MIPEFKAEAVRQVLERGYSVAEIAARLGVSTHRLYKWVKAVTPDKSEKQASELLEAKSETLRLRAQMRRLEEERDIVKKTPPRLPASPPPRRSAAHWVRSTPATLTPLDSGRLLFGGIVPVKKTDPGKAADALVVARFVTLFRNVI